MSVDIGKLEKNPGITFKSWERKGSSVVMYDPFFFSWLGLEHEDYLFSFLLFFPFEEPIPFWEPTHFYKSIPF